MPKQIKQRKSVKTNTAKKRLSSEDFLKKANKMWQAGPPVKYTAPDSWQRPMN
jgi:hypothetical protein